MAKYNIISLNYITAGKKRAFVNIDTQLDYQAPTGITLLRADDVESKNILTEQGQVEYIDTETISQQKKLLSKDQNNKDIVLKEDQPHVRNVEALDKNNIVLKTKNDISLTREKIEEFKKQMTSRNRTFEFEIDENNSKNNLHDISDDVSIYPVYDIQDIALKSANKKKQKNSHLYNTGSLVDIYAPQLDDKPIEFCQAQDYSYILTEWMTKSPQFINIALNDSTDNSYYGQITSENLNTYFYERVKNLSSQYCSSYQTYSQYFKDCESSAQITSVFAPKYNYKGINYNYIIDVNQNQNDTEYDAGNVPASNINIGKNIYDSLYTVKMKSSATIENSRTYCGIQSMNDNIYLKYVDSIYYDTLTTRNNKDLGVKDITTKYRHKRKYFIRNIKTGKIKKDANLLYSNSFYDYDYDYNDYEMVQLSVIPFQKLEMYKPNYYSSGIKHKPTVFSVRLNNTHIDELEHRNDTDDEEIYNQKKLLAQTLKKDITNTIREIAKNIAPANTQLFDVYFNDD